MQYHAHIEVGETDMASHDGRQQIAAAFLDALLLFGLFSPPVASAAEPTGVSIVVEDARTGAGVPHARLYLQPQGGIAVQVPAQRAGRFNSVVDIAVGTDVAVTVKADLYETVEKTVTWKQNNVLPTLKISPMVAVEQPTVTPLPQGFRVSFEIHNGTAASVRPDATSIVMPVAPRHGCAMPGDIAHLVFPQTTIPVGGMVTVAGRAERDALVVPVFASAASDLDDCSGGTIEWTVSWSEALAADQRAEVWIDLGPVTLSDPATARRIALAPATAGCVQSAHAAVRIGDVTLDSPSSTADGGICLAAKP